MKKIVWIKSIVVLVLVLFSTNTNAQRMYDLRDFYTGLGGNHAPITRATSAQKPVEGSPFARSEYVKGTVIRNNGDIYQNIPLRYNKYEDRIEFEDVNGKDLYIDNPSDYKFIIIDDQQYIYGEFLKENKKVKGYYVLLEVGKVSLLKKQLCGLKKAEPAKPFQDPKPAKFYTKTDEFYILINQKNIEKVKNEKECLAILQDQKNKLAKYIKSEKLKVKKEEDLKKLIEYYNTL